MSLGPNPIDGLDLAEIVAALGGDLHGDPALSIRRIGALDRADGQTITFLAQAKFKGLLASTGAACVIVRPDALDALHARGISAIVTPDPYLYFARLTRFWAARFRRKPSSGIHPSAVIEEGARLHPSVCVGPQAVIEGGAVLGEGVVIGAHAYVGFDVQLGAQTRLAARATVAEACRIGARAVIHSGAVIGADGFGFAPSEGRWEKIEQLGAVSIGDDVEIGANTCVDRGALDDTVIEDGVKLDNQIQIAHNVRIGKHTAMAGCDGVAGSTRIGAGCTIGGAAMIVGHIEIGDGVHISAASVVMSSILKPGHYSGVFPIDDHGSWEKNAATLRQLHTLRSRLRALEKKIQP